MTQFKIRTPLPLSRATSCSELCQKFNTIKAFNDEDNVVEEDRKDPGFDLMMMMIGVKKMDDDLFELREETPRRSKVEEKKFADVFEDKWKIEQEKWRQWRLKDGIGLECVWLPTKDEVFIENKLRIH